MGNVVAIQEEKPKKKSPIGKFSYYLEDPKAQYLLMGTDEHGKTVYFFKMRITGLQDRIFGPYDSRSMAVECSIPCLLQHLNPSAMFRMEAETRRTTAWSILPYPRISRPFQRGES